jgi:hypothetical protein
MTGRDDPLGRRALFSSTTGEQYGADRPTRRRRVVVECGACGVRTPLRLLRLPCQLTPSLWVPTRRLSHLMRCPNCRRLAWCRLDWWGLLGA